MIRFFVSFRVTCAVLVLFLILTFFCIPSYSADVFLGVDEGDWASYSIETSWFSEIEGETVPPQFFVDINQTEWKLQVEEILDIDQVKLNITKYLKNGTESEVYEGSVRTISGELKMWVVSKNLNDKDRIYKEEEIFVNSTSQLRFAGASRSMIYASFGQVELDESISAHSIYWDRETGILCDWVVQYRRVVEDRVSRTHIRVSIIETNLWEPSGGFLSLEVMLFLALIAAVIVSAGVVFWFSRKRKRLKKRRSR